MEFESIDEFDDSDGPIAICIAMTVTAAGLATSVGLLGGNIFYGAISGLVVGTGATVLVGWRKLLFAALRGLLLGAIVGGIAWWICGANGWDVSGPRLNAALIGAWIGFGIGLFRNDPPLHDTGNIRDAIPMALLWGSGLAAIGGGIAWWIIWGNGWTESATAGLLFWAVLLSAGLLGGYIGWQLGLEGPPDFSEGSEGSWGSNFWSGDWFLADKSCSNCGRSVSLGSEAGQRCPHCGAYWSSEHTIYRGGDDD